VVAIAAQHLEVWRASLVENVSIDSLWIYLPTMFCTIVIHMVDNQKREFSLSAAIASIAVSAEDFKSHAVSSVLLILAIPLLVFGQAHGFLAVSDGGG
jgi:predicted branched-subunit amino acid permease